MRLARSRRIVVAAVSLAAAAAIATPTIAHAEPAKTESQSQDLPIPSKAPDVNPAVLQSLGAFAPALIGSAATRDDQGNLNTKLLDDARKMADNPSLPPEVAGTWRSLIDFLGQPGKDKAAKVQAAEDAALKNPAAEKDDAPNIPTGPGKPRIQQFLYPTIGLGCMPGGNSVGLALATAGPQQAPAPGPKRGQAGYVYTSLGTGPALKNSAAPLWVTWLNVDNGRTGQVRLLPNAKINADKGPGTFTGIANTGRGRVISTVYGNVTTKTKGKRVSCTIVPTIGTSII